VDLLVDMEAAIMAIPGVSEAAVIAIRTQVVERPLACLVIADGAPVGADDVRAHLEASGFADGSSPHASSSSKRSEDRVGKFDKKSAGPVPRMSVVDEAPTFVRVGPPACGSALSAKDALLLVMGIGGNLDMWIARPWLPDRQLIMFDFRARVAPEGVVPPTMMHTRCSPPPCSHNSATAVSMCSATRGAASSPAAGTAASPLGPPPRPGKLDRRVGRPPPGPMWPHAC